MTARVPASSANLGPGFDTLAVALSMHIEVDIEPAEELEIVTEGYGAGHFDDERHLGVRVAKRVLGHDRFRITVRSEIPVARGLGSSAALALAAASAAGSVDPLALAVEIDGHAENAAASLAGGLVVATVDHGRPVYERLALDPAFRFVVVIPDAELETTAAREVLPTSVAFGDATFNLARLALLIVGLSDHRRFHAMAMDDRLHQRYRGPLLNFSEDVLTCLVEAGALASCWSGAGSTMLGIALDNTASDVGDAARTRLGELSVPGIVKVLEADVDGLVTS